MPAGFVGDWYGHGRALTVRSDGAVTMTFRLYVYCTARQTTRCDRISGGTIHDGGNVTAHVSQVVNPTTVIMTVTQTSAPRSVPLGTVRLGHDMTHHAVAIFSGQLSGVPFCGSGASSGYCGA